MRVAEIVPELLPHFARFVAESAVTNYASEKERTKRFNSFCQKFNDLF